MSDVVWSSSDEAVLTVSDGIVNAVDIGSATITAQKGGKTWSVYILVRGLTIISESNGVCADNLEGNMDISESTDSSESVILELEVAKLNSKDWKQWGQLKKVFEQALEKAVICSDVFDISVKLKGETSTWKVQPIDGEKISIWMPIRDVNNLSKRHLMHVNEDGTISELNYEYEQIDGLHGIRFETDSFSEFVLVEESSVAALGLPDFILPASLTTIDAEAFTGGAFTYVKLPDGVVSIGPRAFADCPNLAYIYIPAAVANVDQTAFGNMQGLTIIGVPGSTAETYANNHSFTFIPSA